MGNTCFSQVAVLIWSSFCLRFFILHPIPKLIKLAPLFLFFFFCSLHLVRLFHTFIRQLGFSFWSHSLFHSGIPWLPNLKKMHILKFSLCTLKFFRFRQWDRVIYTQWQYHAQYLKVKFLFSVLKIKFFFVLPSQYIPSNSWQPLICLLSQQF